MKMLQSYIFQGLMALFQIMKKLNELFDCNYDTEIKGIKINSKKK